MIAKEFEITIKSVKRVQSDVFLLSFQSSFLARKARPGTFIHVKIPFTILRRPFSIHKIEADTIYILFRIRGRGTTVLSQMKKGGILNIIGPLGNGFSYERRATDLRSTKKLKNQKTKEQKKSDHESRALSNESHILIAGGIGVAPLLFLAQKLGAGTVLLGAKSKDHILCEKEFKQLGFKVHIATDDGTKGTQGTAIDLLKKLTAQSPPRRHVGAPLIKKHQGAGQLTAHIYSCGPEPMFKQIHALIKDIPTIHCQVSFEQFMGCGLGICCGCTIDTKHGFKKVCKDGPVFDIREIW